MKIARKIICVIGMLLVPCAVFMLLCVLPSLQLRWHFDRLVETNDHAAVARAAITVMRSAADKDVLIGGNHLANLPPVIAGMKPNYVVISSKRMSMEFHGGFNHFGFDIVDQGKSWEMSWYTEDERHTLLSVAKDESEQANTFIDKSNISK